MGTSNKSKITVVQYDTPPGDPLSPWTYSNAELFELEYDAFFLRRWQLLGHVNDAVEPGDYFTGEIGRDSIAVIRGQDGELRAFRNVCRHRASRILEGQGTCRGVIRCPYHGWTYRLDGSLMAIPQEDTFEEFDRADYNLHNVQLEVFHGLVFVRIKGDGHTVAEQFAHTEKYFDMYGVEDYVSFTESSTQVWDCNWKVAWDNYLENYHIAIGHPGLHRLVKDNGEGEELSSGVSVGEFDLRDKLSKVSTERAYQEQMQHAQHRVPEELRWKWVQFGLSPNLGIDLYPEMLDTFQLIPLGPEKTMVRAAFYGHKNPSPEETELRRLNMLVNDPINTEDQLLCTRVQQGLHTFGYSPGPLSSLELAIFNFHEMIRRRVPVAALLKAPAAGSVATLNSTLLESK